MNRRLVIAAFALSWLATAGFFVAAEYSAPVVSEQSPPTQRTLAARYHLRKRTDNFYDRAKPGGNTAKSKR